MEAMESTRLRRYGGGSLTRSLSLLLPLVVPEAALEIVPVGVPPLVVLPWLLSWRKRPVSGRASTFCLLDVSVAGLSVRSL